MNCVLCDRLAVVGVVANERIICDECWRLTHKLLGAWQ